MSEWKSEQNEKRSKWETYGNSNIGGGWGAKETESVQWEW